MGHTVQLQWSFNPPAGRQISLADIILPRILESYSLHTPSRSTIQFRTYRSTFPSPPTSSSSTEPTTKSTSRYLTTINTLPNPLPPGSTPLQDNTKEEDITYLFLDDRSALTSHLPSSAQTSNGVDQTQQTNGASNSKKVTPKQSQRQPERFKCLAVRPTSNVQPMLQSLLSPFVMGYSKSAKAAASTTSSTLPTPTPLAGNSLLLTVLSFTPFSPPTSTSIEAEYSLKLKVFILPNPNATSIFLQVEYASTQDPNGNSSLSEKGQETQDQNQDQICRVFLEGCLIDGLNDHRKWVNVNDSAQSSKGRDNIFALTRSMRESGFI
uniref:Uncharacterized protein n=1 Tax=Kwoniella bestiolae CBS 10118 TaxID=1296100 RepID=A0A1B9G884_9TREE|nr:hypothetical protein I302_02052 [Kwoniella bestiolae CBS 10118]OCF27213.1 hypothetical protein I302_02052 [Kwoniella bestiolae CBS 10118]